MFHLLKLFSLDPEVSVGTKTLVNEYYDEIVFHEPSQFFYQLLTNVKPLTTTPGAYKHDTDCTCSFILSNVAKHLFFFISHLSVCSSSGEVTEKEKQTLEKLQQAKEKVRNEIRDIKDRLKLAQENMQTLREKIESDELVIEDAT